MNIFSSFSRIIILAAIISHVVFSIILYSSIKVYIEKSHKEQYINVVNSTSKILANHASNILNEKNRVEDFLDGIQNSGDITFVEIEMENGIVFTPQKSPNTLTFQEDLYLFQHNDDTYFVTVKIHSKTHSIGFAKFGFSEQKIRNTIEKAYKNSLYLTLIYLAILIALLIFLIPRFTSSLRLLNIAAQNISSGNPNVNLRIETDIYEFKSLISSLEIMRTVLVDKNEDVRRKEMYIRVLMNRMADSMIVLDTKMRIKLLNTAALKCFGYAQKELVGQTFTKLLSPCNTDDKCTPCEIFNIEKHISMESENSAMECTGKRADDSVFPVKLYFTNFEYDSEHIVICNSHDLTEQKNEELKLIDALECAEQSNKSKSIFLSSMSHELRTPLNAIIGYSEILLEEEDILKNACATSDITKIRKSGKHLLSIINSILNLSKIEAGKMEINRHEFLLNQLVEESVFTVSTLFEKNNNQFELNFNAKDIVIYSDYSKVKQALLNLLGNATKFTSNGKVTLNIWIENEASPFIVFSIIDTGIGIDKKDMQNLFKEFSQGNVQVMNTYGGTGLGLVISRKYCELLGGKIEVRSELGKGSTFTMSIPLSLR